MKDKVKSTDDCDEDIPFPENWKRVDVDEMKQNFMDWLDDNIEHQYTIDPEFYLSDSVNEKRFYFRVIESGGCDVEPPDPDDEGYRCVFVPFDTKRVEDL